jgi:hypothetical protein
MQLRFNCAALKIRSHSFKSRALGVMQLKFLCIPLHGLITRWQNKQKTLSFIMEVQHLMRTQSVLDHERIYSFYLLFF